VAEVYRQPNKTDTKTVSSGSNTSWVNNLFQYKAGSIKIYLLLIITVKHKT